MREILFRGKSQYTGKWGESVCPLGLMHSGHLCNDFIPETVGQFTGLTDKNGKRIFEGDILRRAYHPNDDVIVEWHDGRFVFHKRIYPKDYGYESLVCCQQNVDRLAIIGNIHDNPELLKGGFEDG